MSQTTHTNKKLFSSAALFTTGQLLIRSLSIISTPILTALMSQKDFGITSTFITWYTILSAIFSLYTQSSIAMGSIDYQGKQYKSYLSSVVSLSTSSFLLFGAIFFFARGWIGQISGFPASWMPYLLIISYAYYLLNFYQTVLIYDGRQGRYLIISLFVSVVGLALSLWLVPTLPNKALGRIIGLTAPVIIIALLALIRLFRFSSTFNLSYWKYSLKLSLPMIINYISIYLIAQISILFLQHYQGFSMVGTYSASYTLVEMLNYFSTGVHQAWSPWYFNKLKSGITSGIQSVLQIFVKIIGCVFCGFILVIPEIARILINYKFWAGFIIIPIIAISLFLKFASNFYVSHFIYCKKNPLISIVTVLSLMAQVGASFFLVPQYNLIGAALGSLLSNLVLLIIYSSIVTFKKINIPFHHFFYWKELLLIVLSSIIFFICYEYWLLRWGIACIFGIYLVVYLVKNKNTLKGIIEN